MRRFLKHFTPKRTYSGTQIVQSETVTASQSLNADSAPALGKKLTLADIRTSLRPALKPRSLYIVEEKSEKEEIIDDVTKLKPYDPIANKKDFLYSKEGNFHPEFGFMNALEIASPIDIYKTYLIARKNGQATLDKIPEKSFIDLLERCAKGQFGFLKGYALLKFATQVRSDYLARGASPSPFMDSLVIECASFIPAESLDRVVRFVATNYPALSTDPAQIPIYNSLMKVFGTSQRIEAAEELYMKLASSNLDLSTPSLALFKVYCQEGLMEKAEELYYGLEKNGISISNKSSYLVALIRGWAKLGNIQQTRKYFGKFGLKDEPHLRTIAFAALIQCYAIRGLPGDAGFAYKDLRDQGLAASPNIFESMIRSFIPGKDITGANRWFQKILGAKLLRPSMGMYEALMRAHIAGGENLVAWKTFAKSLTAFKYIRSKSSRVHISFSMAEALVDNIRGKHIDYLRDHMRLSFVPVAHRGEVLAKLMYASLNHSIATPDPKLALAIYNEFHDKNGCASEAGITIMAHINAMRAYGMEGDVKSTQKIFDSIIDTSFDREVEAYNVLIDAYVRVGDKENAKKYLSEFKSHGLEPTASTFESMLALAQGDQEQIKQLAKQIDAHGCVVSPKSHPLIAKALRDNGLTFLPTAFIKAIKHSKIEMDLYALPAYEILVNSSLRYEDFAQNDFKLLTIGSNWKCLLPIKQGHGLGIEEKASDSATLPDPIKAASRLNMIPCIYQIQDGRYWQYEFCSRKSIKQFHPLHPNQKPGKNDEYYLGIYSKKVKPELVIDTSAEGVTFYHLRETWADGTVCDLNGERRQTVIEYFCSQEEKFESIRETASCNYKIIINTPKLCYHPSFVRQKPSKATQIQCKSSKIYNEDKKGLEPIPFENLMGYPDSKKTHKESVIADEVDIQLDPKAASDRNEALDNLLKNIGKKEKLAAIMEAAIMEAGVPLQENGAPEVSIIYLNMKPEESESENEASEQPSGGNDDKIGEKEGKEGDEL